MIDATALSRRAIGTLRRSGVGRYMDTRDLISVGVVAILQHGTQEEALAVIVARRAMLDALKGNSVRERGRVQLKKGHAFESSGVDLSGWEMWDTTVYGKVNLVPEHMHVDLWGAMRALPRRQYRAVSLVFWGGLTEEQAGGVMGIQKPAVSKLIARAVGALKKKLGGDGNISIPQSITNMRGEETRRAVPLDRTGAQ